MRGKGFSWQGPTIATVMVCFLAVVCASHRAVGEEITIGTGTFTWYFPLASKYRDARTQTIYLASEIGGAFQITGLALYVTTPPGQTLNDFTIRLKHTALSAYAASPQWEPTGWTVAYQANQTISTTGWVQFIFSTPFAYDGIQNLLVDISFSNSSYTNHGYCLYSTFGSTRSIYYATNSGYGDPMTWTARTPAPAATARVPNLKLLLAQITSTPTFSPDGGVSESDQQVVISCATPGAVIHYTTNGVDPTEGDRSVASGASVPVTVATPTQLKARAFREGLAPSVIKAAWYRQPVFVAVSTSGSDSNTGLTWLTPKRTVQAGLNAAAAGDQVWVAAGTYVECITLKAGVALYGGFAGNETDLTQRNWVTNSTVLDGDQAGSVVTSPFGTTSTTRLDGFTIRNGNGTLSGSNRYGGGVYCGASSSPVITNNTITGNSGSGGGIFCSSSSSPAISNNTVTGNSAGGNGGGVCCDYYSSPTISSNAITGNDAVCGGGIYCYTSSPTISKNTISGNNVKYSGGYGGGIYCGSCSPAISNNTISGNTNGSGIYCSSSSPAIFGNTISGNSANYHSGGGICCSSSSPTIFNNRISGNRSNELHGGGIYCGSSSPAISNNTITGNEAVSGGGISCSSSSPTISNTIIAANSSGVHNTGSGTLTLQNNCVFGNTAYNYSGITDPTGTSGNISVDPQLLAANCNEIHLKMGSPCIDAGLDSVPQSGWLDMDGQPRIQGTHVDIGADEFNGATPPLTATVIRVSPAGNDANDGSTWALAKLTVQAGIDAVGAVEGGDVWVASGTYVERITLKQWVHVYAGFAGNESSRDQRDWMANVTILDGEGGVAGSVVTASEPGYLSSTIDGFTIRNGHASYGGGIYCRSSSPVISNDTISGNRGALGGGIYCSSSSPAITNDKISGNSATGLGQGGGIYIRSSFPTIANCTISGNNATEEGGGIYCFASPTIINNTITGNTARYSGGVYCYFGSPVISNNIVAFNTSGVYRYGGTPTLRNNCVYNPAGLDYPGASAGIGDIQLDPLFVNREAGDYRLTAGSPCIDAGYNAAVPYAMLTDLDGHLRFFDDPATDDCLWSPGTCGTTPIVDIGAYEFIPLIPGDFNRDGAVDGHDLDVFVACATGPGVPYNPTDLPEGCTLVADGNGQIAADLNRDGAVDMKDFATLQRCWSGPLAGNFACAH